MDDNEYRKYVKLLSSMNLNSANIEYLNLSSVSEAEHMQSISYSQVISILNKVEGKRAIKREVSQPQVGEAKEVQPHIISSGLQQAQYAQATQVSAVTPPKQKVSSFSKIKEKLAGAAELAVSKKSRIVKEKISIKDLVLPSLSVSDQVSELERIIEGLNEKVFDAEHLEVVAEEVYGLQMVVESEKKAKKNLSELEQSLIALRNQRLADAMAILSKYESGS